MVNQQQIVYTPLTQKIRVSYWSIVVMILSIFSGLALLASIIYKFPDEVILIFIALTAVGFVATIIGLALMVYNYSKAKDARIEAFAAANNWRYTKNVQASDFVPTSLLATGHTRVCTYVIEGTYNNHDIVLFTYEYTVGHGKNAQTSRFSSLRLTFSKTFPHFVIDDVDSFSKFFTYGRLPNRLPDGEELRLEGTFGTHYKVYVEKDTERDVLHVLTPDFMQELLDAQVKADIEFEDKQVHIISDPNVAFDNPANLQVLFALADVVCKHIGELDDTYLAASSVESIRTLQETALQTRINSMNKSGWKNYALGAALIIFILFVFSVVDQVVDIDTGDSHFAFVLTPIVILFFMLIKWFLDKFIQ